MSAAKKLEHIGPYKVIDLIGEGATSRVYRVERDSKTYALKMMKGDGRDAEALRRFHRETATVARFDCENLIKVFESGEAEGSPYILMELVEGQDLRKTLSGGRLASEKVVQVALGVSRALKELHARGVVHRDLKPDNIIIARVLSGEVSPGAIKLVDFGLAGDEAEVGRDAENALMVGTFLYASPEQSGILKRPVDGRSDLYSLGVLLYECLAGRCPYVSSDAGELIRLHASATPQSLRERRADLSPVLEAIVMRLMEKDPDDRYQSATGLVADLESLDALEEAYAKTETVTLRQRDQAKGLSRAPIKGRAADLQKLQAEWAAASAGSGRIALVKGESGSGKSRLALELLQRVATGDRIVLKGKCNALDMAKPFAVLKEAFEHLLADIQLLPAESKEAKLRSLKTAARGLEQSMGRLSPQFKSLLEIQNVEEDPLKFVRELDEFLFKLAKQEGGLLLQLDDVQWLDQASLDFLAAMNLAAGPVFVVATGRSEQENEAGIAAFVAAAGKNLKLDIELAPLARGEIAELIRFQLGGREVDTKLVQKVEGYSHGNPFFIGEFVSSLIGTGALRLERDLWTLDESALGQIDYSKSIFAVVLDRVGKLSPEVRDVLKFASLIGIGFKVALLARIAGRPESQVRSLLANAVTENLVEESAGGGFRFVHDKVRESLESEIEPGEAKLINDRIANCIEEDGAGDAVYELAHHISRGSRADGARVFKSNFAAGQAAALTGAYQQACNYFELARESMPADHPAEAACAFFEAFGLARSRAGQPEEALLLFDEILGRSSSDLQKARVTSLKIESFAAAGEVPKGWRAFKEACVAFGSPHPESAFGIAVSIFYYFFACLFFDFTGLFEGWYRKLPESDPRRQRLGVAVISMDQGYMLAYFNGMPAHLGLICLRQYYYAHLLGEPLLLGKAISSYSLLWGIVGNKRMIDRLMKRAYKICDETKSSFLETQVTGFSAIAKEFVGDVDGALKVATDQCPTLLKYQGYYGYSMHAADHQYQLMFRGETRESIAIFFRHKADIDKSRSRIMMMPIYASAYSQLIMLGRAGEALEFRAQMLAILKTFDEPTKYALASATSAEFVAMYEQNDYGPEIDRHIEEFEKVGLEDYQFNNVRAWVPYIRIAQFERAKDAAEKAKRWKQVRAAIFGGMFRQGHTDLAKCHVSIQRAAAARLKGKFDKAERFIKKGEEQATNSRNKFAMYMAAVERARLERVRGNPIRMKTDVEIAMQMARTQGWVLRLATLREEFGLPPENPSVTTKQVGQSTATRGKKPAGDAMAFDSLLKVSLASATSVDPLVQAQAILNEVIRVFGAERGYVFRSQEEGSLGFACGAASDGTVLKKPSEFSRTVIDKVAAGKKPMVVTGSDQMEDIGAKSAVVHGLRSIMAVPLLLRDQLKGVVYLDSRLAKGLFTEDDVKLFEAAASHIAVAFEISRLAVVEAEKTAYKKDLEVSGAVQALFLPKARSIEAEGLSGAAFYRPATQCGGDWWWSRTTEDRLQLVVGDVTGHGAGPAMITALASTVARAHIREQGGAAADLGRLLEVLDNEINEVSSDRFWMTAVGLDIDLKTRCLRVYGACGPSPQVFKKDSSVSDLSGGKQYPLGTARGISAPLECQLDPGDRIVVFTDGLSELKLANDRMIGSRKLLSLIRGTDAVRAGEAIDQVMNEIDSIRKQSPQEDDITIVMIDVA